MRERERETDRQTDRERVHVLDKKRQLESDKHNCVKNTKVGHSCTAFDSAFPAREIYSRFIA